MPQDPYIRGDLPTARQVEREYFEQFPKDSYDTALERWADLQRHIEFVMKRLREPKVQWKTSAPDKS
jgi:hypothetical protein